MSSRTTESSEVERITHDEVVDRLSRRNAREGVTGDPRALAVILMARLGLRRNEALGLIWDDLDFEAGV